MLLYGIGIDRAGPSQSPGTDTDGHAHLDFDRLPDRHAGAISHFHPLSKPHRQPYLDRDRHADQYTIAD